jgi:enamine deaminase RidA (YjgF/YER057c/UK114 family)
MTVELDTRSVESSVATGIYISATPKDNAPPQDQAQEIFSRIRDVLNSKNAYILQERVFATMDVMEAISRVRLKVYGDVDDGVAPSFLVGKEGMSGPIAGVQVYAISSDSRPEVINLQGTPCGRIIRVPGGAYLTLSSVSAAQSSQATEQARATLEKAESALRQFDVDFLSVPRTWMWLGDILSWYNDFNRVRTDFFTERGLIGEGTRQSMPASTGIGLCCIDGSKCAMDLIAVLQPPDATQYLQAVGKQQCALEYGSAFSRASRAVTPAGETVFVSGTASINASGATTNIGDARGQINTTIENVRAVLRDTQATDEDVVHVVAYCKTKEVEKIFSGLKDALAWPCVTVICDICRPELLFEMEATAITPAKSLPG